MFSKLAIVAVAVFAAVASAAPFEESKPEANYDGQCSVGPQQCCNSVQNADAPQAAQLLGALGLQVAANLLVGVTCSPIGVGAISGGSSCNQQAVCCNDNSFNGIVAIGCTPINIAA